MLTDVPSNDDLLNEVVRLRGEITRLKEMVEQLDELAHQDSLIELPNRRGFMRHLDKTIAACARYNEDAAMLFVDLDGLKLINDSFGHKAGDEALIQVASMLVGGVRRSDAWRGSAATSSRSSSINAAEASRQRHGRAADRRDRRLRLHPRRR